jgi:hypothetical protein
VAWLKATAVDPICSASCDFLTDDVLTHSWDATGNGAGSAAPSEVVWTAPFAGDVDLSGSVWLARNIGRAVDWTLLVNNVMQDSGSLSDGDAFSRAAPDSFLVSGLSVAQNDTIVLRFVTGGNSAGGGEFVGVNLTIDAEPVAEPIPEPTTALLLAGGLAGTAARAGRRKRAARR